MEFIDGETVDNYLRRHGPLAPKEALDIALQVSRALGAAAKQHLVHRDLKPANLMLVDQDGERVVKVIDFGLAKSARAVGDESGTLTFGGGFVGTPLFASPEQLEELDIDIRADIYSLGATLYFMLAGRPPFLGSLAQVMSQHLHKEVPLEALEGLLPSLISLVERMMEKDRDRQIQNPTELRQQIQTCLDELSGSAALSAAQTMVREHSAVAATTDLAAAQSTGKSCSLNQPDNTWWKNRSPVALCCKSSVRGGHSRQPRFSICWRSLARQSIESPITLG